MRWIRIAGVALMATGAAVLVWGDTFTDSRKVLEVGGATVLAEESRPIAPWTAGAVLITGVMLTVIGLVDRARPKA
jgi:hypothetical protein